MQNSDGHAGSRRLRRFGSVLVTLACLAVLLKIANFQDLTAIILSANIVLVLAAVLFRAADRLVMIAKWFPLLRVQVPRVTFITAARGYVASGIAHYLLPFSVGADVVRATTLGRDEQSIHGVSASIIAERLLGMAATGILCMVALLIAMRASVDLTVLFPWAGLAITLGLLALLAPLVGPFADPVLRWLGRFRHRPAAGFLERLAIAYRAYRNHGELLFRVGMISVAEQLFPVIIAGTVALSLGIVVSLPMLLVAVPLALFAARLPLSIGGIGVAEGAMVYLLGLFGIPMEQALALSLVIRAVDIFVVAVPGALLWQHLLGASQVDELSSDTDAAGSSAAAQARVSETTPTTA